MSVGEREGRLHAQFWDMTENCLVRVHQEMDERENSLHVVRGERWSSERFRYARVLMAAEVEQRQARDGDDDTTFFEPVLRLCENGPDML